ncbi:hypothetical protein [Micromonospora sp. HM5-17]|uniref:hypothetical protein n=1 Tax=Micromonospora sp. HM5-17 TaxID=2487710 RepID=UPI0011CD8C5B|nr:hypothetical protein [Micromonospora sp. HM5-17]
MITTADLADRARAVLARFDTPPRNWRVIPEQRIDWACACYRGGDHTRAIEELTACLEGPLPPRFATVSDMLTREQAVRLAYAALDGEQPFRRFVGSLPGSPNPGPPVAGTLARLVAGDPDAEEALLRKVLEDRPSDDSVFDRRAVRISDVISVLAEAHVGEPEYLDRWSALLGERDRPRLAAAAALLGPLGLAEIERRCGTVEANVDGERLIAAFVAADRFDDALTLAARLYPDDQQCALLTLAVPGLAPARAKALVTAFRKCPRLGRSEVSRMTYQHRFARLFLGLERVDDALAVLGRMRHRKRDSKYGPAPLARELVRWLAARREAATPERLRAILEALVGPWISPESLGDVVLDVVRLASALADEQLRAEILEVHVPRLQERLADRTYWPALIDAVRGVVLVEAGDPTALDPVFAKAAQGYSWVAVRLVDLAFRTGLPARDLDLFGDLVTTAFPRIEDWRAFMSPSAADARTVLPRAVAGREYDSEIADVATVAGQADDLSLLAAMLDAAPDVWTAWRVAEQVALTLARRGELRDAVDIARRCGLLEGKPEEADG